MRNCKPATCLFGRDPIALAVALACVAPVAAAQPMFGAALNAHADMSDYSESNIEVGVGYNSQDSFKFGEFTGLEEDGAFLILNGNYEQRSADDDRRYWSVSGSNVGLPSRVVEGELGQQGNFSVDARFDQLTRYQYDTTGFIHRGLGGDSLSLPGGFPGLTANNGQPPDNAATIGRYLESYDIKQERDGYELGLKKLFGTDWGLNARYRLEERDGTKLIGSVIGTSGGNPRAVILPRPTEDKTHQLELSADYFGASTQVQLGYYLSLYQPENDSLTWANPFRNTGWTGVVNQVSFPNGDGRLSLDPENEFHQINLSAAHAFSDDLRVNGRLSWGRMTQDDDFLDYTVNPLLTVNTGLPQDSLDGEITNTVVDLAAMWRPIHTLNLKASYLYDDRDNGTDQYTYKYIGGDAMNQPVTLADCSTTTGAGVSQCRTNLPVSSTEQKFKLQGDYEIFDRTKLDAGYEYEQVQRTYEARENTRQNSILVGVRRVQSEMLTGRLEYEYSDRNGSDYDALVPFNATYADPRFQIQQTGPYAGRPNWDTLPSLRKFHLADRERDKLRALGTITPTARTSIQVAFDYYNDDYNASDYGLTEGKGYTATLDASYAFSDKGSVFAFYTYDHLQSDQTGKEFTGAPSKYDREFDTRFDWTADLENVSNTFGLGGDYKLSDRLTLGALYVYNDSKGKTDVDTGPGLAAAQSVPDVEAKLNSLQLYAKYNLKENVALRFEYWYEQFSSDDWAYDGANPWSSNNVVTTGQDSSDYTDHVFGVAVQVKFQ